MENKSSGTLRIELPPEVRDFCRNMIAKMERDIPDLNPDWILSADVVLEDVLDAEFIG